MNNYLIFLNYKKYILLLLICISSYNLYSDSHKLEHNLSENIRKLSDDANSNPYGNAFYQFFELSLSIHEESDLSIDSEILGVNVSFLTDNLLIGFSLLQLSVKSNDISFSIFEMISRLNLFDFHTNNGKWQSYDFLHIKFRPLSTKYLYNNFIYNPQIFLGNDFTIRYDLLSVFVSTDYVFHLLDSGKNHFILKTGIRLAIFGPFIPV